MNKWFKKVAEQIKTLWGKWSAVQKIVLFSVIGVVIVGLFLIVFLNSRPNTVPLFNTAISVEDKDRITLKLDEEGILFNEDASGRIVVDDERTARRARMIINQNDLVPETVGAWDFFNMDRWTITDFERDVQLRRALEQNLELYVETLSDVDNAEATLVLEEVTTFAEDQRPVTASIIITPSPGSDIQTNRSKIEAIVRLVQMAVSGLDAENIIISDHNLNQLNDFENLDKFDDLEITKRQLQQKDKLESQYKNQVLEELRGIFGTDRVRILKVDIDLEMVKKVTDTTEYFPIEVTPENPETPYPDREVVTSVLRSSENTDEHYKGTGINPNGPPGQEGQTSPQYADVTEAYGTYDNTSTIENYEINERQIYEEAQPWAINRLTIAIAIDGTWKRLYDEEGKLMVDASGSIQREYTEVDDDMLGKAESLVRDAVGYDIRRGDSVTVEGIMFDRSAQHNMEDEEYRRQEQIKQAIIYTMIGIAVVIVAFIVFRLISREMERRRRLREEELSRQHQAMREAALRSAEEEGVDVQMSVEERARLDMQEHAINMAREHPEDVAQLIRTWLIEE